MVYFMYMYVYSVSVYFYVCEVVVKDNLIIYVYERASNIYIHKNIYIESCDSLMHAIRHNTRFYKQKQQHRTSLELNWTHSNDTTYYVR